MNQRLMKLAAIVVCSFAATVANAGPSCTLQIFAAIVPSMDKFIVNSGSSFFALHTTHDTRNERGDLISVSSDEACVQTVDSLKSLESFNGAQGLCMPDWNQIQKAVASYSQRHGSEEGRNLVNCAEKIAARIDKDTRSANPVNAAASAIVLQGRNFSLTTQELKAFLSKLNPGSEIDIVRIQQGSTSDTDSRVSRIVQYSMHSSGYVDRPDVTCTVSADSQRSELSLGYCKSPDIQVNPNTINLNLSDFTTVQK